MTARIGIDGGQSAIRARFSDSDLVVTGPGATRFEGSTTQRLLDVLGRLEERRQLVEAVIVAGMTDVPADDDEAATIAENLLEATGAAEVSITEDIVTAHAGAFAGSEGVVLVVGTGAVAFAAAPGTERIHRFDGAGFLIGDEGSAFWIGRHALRAVLKAGEGRGPRTALQDGVVARWGPVDGSLAARVHATPHAVDAIAQVAVDVVDLASSDEVAGGILDAAASRLAATAVAAVSTLDGCADVALSGRLLTQGAALRERLVVSIAALAPDVSVAVAAGSPLDGACATAAEGVRSPYRSHLVTVGRER